MTDSASFLESCPIACLILLFSYLKNDITVYSYKVTDSASFLESCPIACLILLFSYHKNDITVYSYKVTDCIVLRIMSYSLFNSACFHIIRTILQFTVIR